MLLKSVSLLALLLASLWGLAACGDDDDDDLTTATASATASPTLPASAGPTATPTPAFAGTTLKTEKQSQSVAQANLNQLRFGEDSGFDRVVFQFSGSLLPGYSIEYVTPPAVGCASGLSIDISGGAVLLVKFRPANAHNDQGQPTVANLDARPQLKQIVDAKVTCDFEGLVSWGVGVKSKTGYRVMELTGPSRLVIDILH